MRKVHLPVQTHWLCNKEVWSIVWAWLSQKCVRHRLGQFFSMMLITNGCTGWQLQTVLQILKSVIAEHFRHLPFSLQSFRHLSDTVNLNWLDMDEFWVTVLCCNESALVCAHQVQNTFVNDTAKMSHCSSALFDLQMCLQSNHFCFGSKCLHKHVTTLQTNIGHKNVVALQLICCKQMGRAQKLMMETMNKAWHREFALVDNRTWAISKSRVCWNHAKGSSAQPEMEECNRVGPVHCDAGPGSRVPPEPPSHGRDSAQVGGHTTPVVLCSNQYAVLHDTMPTDIEFLHGVWIVIMFNLLRFG